ncbi:hypothetical protein FSP39_012769 [Pinctada imbricata]|uniref:Uncharacterized protein n=1 Tax=Pinctada imbricata TaxID=66713 RepID=A0AA89BZQ1_PINIB|nr:hypothetical protein FSP39_012769 [Pinctada imbricata]
MTDEDECTSGTAQCDHGCINTIGSFKCTCREGYELSVDQKTCEAINRCAVRNGGCEQICQSEAGQQSCDCFNGYRLNTDKTTCSDIDECTEQLSGCEQDCNNTVGSFICSCKKGFQLDSNNKTCSDKDECQSFNGGCEEICTNLIGSYTCSCPAGRTLLPDGRTCSGMELPHVGGVSQPLTMLSTSPWYTRTSNSDVVVTDRVVMVNATSSTVPVSLAGVELDLSHSTSIITQYKGKSFADLIPSLGEVIDTNDCIAQNLSSRDMYEFISSDSLINAMFDTLLSLLPPWMTLERAQITNGRGRRSVETPERRVHRHKRSLVDINNLNTQVVLGEQVENLPFCKGAPVKPGNRYSVLQFQTNFSVEVFNNEIFLPSPLRGEEFCLIVDISEPGSVFLMIPEQSRDLFLQLDIFKTLNDKNGLHVKPRGIGLSLNQGVQVPSRHKELTLWNGDHIFKYLIRKEASVWMGGDMTYSSSVLTMDASIDMFLTVPDVKDMLIAMFIEEWNAFATAKASGNITLKFKLMGKNYTLFLQDLLTSNLDMYMSVGGLQPRQWCGQSANPPGVFFSALLQINPFKGVPIVGDWLFYNTHKVYAFAMTDPASRITPNMTIDIKNDIIQIKDVVTRFKSLLDTEKRRLQSLVSNITFLVINELSQKLILFETDISQVLAKWQINGWRISDIKDVLKRFWKSLTDVKDLTRKIRDQLEHYVDAVVQNFRTYIQNEIDIIKNNIAIAIGKLRSQISDALKKYSAFGLKYRTTITIFGLDIIGVDLEAVYSADFLMRCSRFDKVRNLLKGEEAFRALGRISVGRKLGYFISAQFGGGVGVAISKSSDKVVVQLNAFVSILGIRFTGDLFITKNSLSTYVEGNVWGIFLAQIDIEAETGKKWYQLTFNVRGRFVAKAKRKKRQVQTRSESFQASYLDALKKVVRRTADWAERRLSDAQDALKAGEKGLSKAQNWLDEKKEDLRGANKVFDKAVEKLQRAKDKLEAAKGPFKRAMEKLNKAQRKVDRLCRIRSCRKLCLPGVKCKICRKKVGWAKIPYPCCRFTSCMIRFPDPICVAANLACRVVRGIAYAALEAAKLFVRAPMAALDIAKGAVSVTQFAVDKSRVVLKVAEGVLEVAKLGLEGAKATLRIARGALEAIKIAIGAAAKILEFVISFGLQSLVDVKNCGFDVQLSTVDLPAFEVGCDVNLFRLGWIPIRMKINFKNPIASLWSAAKATIDAVAKNFKNVFGKRKRRDIAFETTHQILRALRKARSVGNDTDFLQLLNDTAVLFNNSIDITKDSVGLDGVNNDENNFDYENRRLSFERKCTLLTAHLNFLKDTIETLFDLANETKESMDTFSYAEGNLDKYDINEIGGNMTLEKANISVDYAKHYNLTREDLEQAMKDAKQVIMNDEYLQDIDQVASSSKATMQAEADSVDINMFINSWMTALENITAGHFNESDCVDFRDCLLHSLSAMYDLFSGDEHSNISEIEPVLDEIAENIFSIVQNSTLPLDEIYNNTHALKKSLILLNDFNVYCSKPPTFSSQLSNVTVYEGGTAVFVCDVTASPDPSVWWFKDDELIDGETESILEIRNVSIKDVALYSCMAGNLVANLTSNKADLLIAENIHNISTCSVDNGGCDQLCTNMVGTVLCTCNEGYKISSVDKKKCEDIDECKEMQHGCKSCNNSDGSFTCVCSTGHIFDEQNKRCIKGNDMCALINLDCSQTSGCHVDETGGMACYCDDGFILSSNGTSCIDVDECLQNVCDHTCTNTLGSYTCSCNIGYQLQYDECVACEFPFWGPDCSNVCNCAAASSCDPVNGCLCEEGWQGENCDIDVDECQVYTNICNNTVQECFNEEGFYSCLCPEGYTEANNGSCVDIKECSEVETQCSQICNELEGSFSCDCYSGYYLDTDNKTCSAQNMVLKYFKGCHSNTYGHNCSNTCNCNPDHTTNRNQMCDTATGSCICNASWTGVTCDDDVNECSDVTVCDNLQNTGCHNEIGSYECDCLRGFVKTTTGDCVADKRNNGSIDNSGKDMVISLTMRMEITLPTGFNLNVTKTYRMTANEITESLIQYFKRYIDDNFNVLIHDLRIGSLIVDFSLIMNNTGTSYQSAVKAAWVLLKGVSMPYNNQSLAAYLVYSKSGVGQCQLRSQLIGPCDVGENCIEDRNGPICRKDNTTNLGKILKLSPYTKPFVYVLSGVIAMILVLAVAGLIAYILRSRFRVNNYDSWLTNTAESSAKPKCQWIKKDHGQYLFTVVAKIAVYKSY